ncbi:putative RNA helicase [Helianthus anomalus]
MICLVMTLLKQVLVQLVSIFGFGPFARQFTGKDAKVALELSFMEVVQGCTKNIATTLIETTWVTYRDGTIHMEEGPGDILVFLSGQEEIESIEGLVHENLKKLPEANQKLLIYPLFSSLPSEKQMKVFTPAPDGFRKLTLATNIAEISVTIPGVKYVIDPGLVDVCNYSPDSGIESLIVVKTSKALALQRR